VLARTIRLLLPKPGILCLWQSLLFSQSPYFSRNIDKYLYSFTNSIVCQFILHFPITLNILPSCTNFTL